MSQKRYWRDMTPEEIRAYFDRSSTRLIYVLIVLWIVGLAGVLLVKS